MIRSIVSVGLTILSSFVLRVHSLSAIQGSPCYDTCNGDQATSSGDIVCIDDDFQNTRKGRVLSTCMNCLRTSSYKNDIIGDGVLFLYYMSSVQQTCLSGRPGPPISDCSGLCGDLSSAFSSIGGRGFFQSPYTYCNTSNNVYEDDAPDCARCLRAQDGTVILGNFVYLGNKACMDQPDILNGQTIMGSDSLFNITNLGSGSGNATVTPSSNSTRTSTTLGAAMSTSATQSSKASSTSAASNVKDTVTDEANGGLSRGAAAGIGLVLGMIGIAAIVVFALMARRRMVMKQSGGSGPAAANRPWKRMLDSPEMRNAIAPPPPLPQMSDRGATPPAAGVFVPPVPPVPPVPRTPRTPKTPKTSKSFRSLRSFKSLRLTPRSYYAANPKSSAEVTALPQRGWD